MNVSDLNFSCLSPLPSNAISVHHCHPQKLPLSSQPPSQTLSLGIFVQWSDVILDLTQKLDQQWGSLTLPSWWFLFLGSVSPQMAPSVTRNLDWSFDNVFSNWYPWCLLQHLFFFFWEFQQAEMHSLFVLKAFLVGWKGTAACLIMFIS